jgi:hypothetical protein
MLFEYDASDITNKVSDLYNFMFQIFFKLIFKFLKIFI